jgi:FkbM family methyltransferase
MDLIEIGHNENPAQDHGGPFTVGEPRATASVSLALRRTRYGVLKATQSDDLIARSLAEYGEWIDQELDTLGALIDQGHVAVQYGAEYGVHALYLSSLVGKTGEVHVVEPRRLQHIDLCMAVALNDLSNVYPHHAALAERIDRVELKASGEQPAERTPTLPLDAMGLSQLHLLKINPPGVLMSVLAGASETLRRFKPAIYFRLSTMELAATEVAALKTHGYRCWSHHPHLYNPSNLSGNKHNIFPGWAYQNVVAIHRDAPARFDGLTEI